MWSVENAECGKCGGFNEMKNLNFVAGMTLRFVSAKRLIRYFSNCDDHSSLSKHN